jgi:hypothetical protein
VVEADVTESYRDQEVGRIEPPRACLMREKKRLVLCVGCAWDSNWKGAFDHETD